jgi:hypothetical protein
VVAVHPAAAKWFADPYGGAAFTESTHISFDGKLDGRAVASLIEGVSFDRSFSVGGRFGYWFESLKLFGLGLDVSHFRPDIRPQTVMAKGQIIDMNGALLGVPINASGAAPVTLAKIDQRITAVSFDLMLRWPMLVSTNFPHGQLRPDVTVGPGIYVTALRRFDTNESHGIKSGGGVTWGFKKNIGVFSEYRYTHFRPSLDAGEITLKTTSAPTIFSAGSRSASDRAFSLAAPQLHRAPGKYRSRHASNIRSAQRTFL